MAKNKIFESRGMREFYSVKGCNSCCDCKYLKDEKRYIGHYYECAKDPRHNSFQKKKFPYDNTKCQEFEPHE